LNSVDSILDFLGHACVASIDFNNSCLEQRFVNENRNCFKSRAKALACLGYTRTNCLIPEHSRVLGSEAYVDVGDLVYRLRAGVNFKGVKFSNSWFLSYLVVLRGDWSSWCEPEDDCIEFYLGPNVGELSQPDMKLDLVKHIIT